MRPSAEINFHHLPACPSLFVFISHCPSLFVLHLPSLCLTLSCLRASICLQSFPPSPHPLVFSFLPDFLSSPLSPFQLLLHLSQFDSSRDWCSYQSQKPSLVRDDWTQRHFSTLTPSLFYLSRSPSFNKFVPVNKPSQMTPSS